MGKRSSQFFYITHVDNLPSILQKGILSHGKIESENVPYTPIYDKQIVNRRKERPVNDSSNLWDYANVFFRADNAMLYRVLREKSVRDIIIIGINKTISKQKGVFFSIGNAASLQSVLIQNTDPELDKFFKEINASIQKEWWTDVDGSKRKMMAECLCPGFIPTDFISAIYVASPDMVKDIQKTVGNRIPVIPEPLMFFRPSRQIRLSSNLSLAKGDMFFSEMQTLTISVNCVGVMGKGLASRAKDQFPDVYVGYQALCHNKTLQPGKPALIKREIARDKELADSPETMTDLNRETWFLLFPTKDHWKNPADIKAIETGLKWICENYQQQGIKSLAVPALGCGLGWLSWSQVGPLMCKYLSKLTINTCIYLPTEEDTSDELLTKEFLLGD